MKNRPNVANNRPVTTTQRATLRPEFILSALGDMVFDGDEWYEELLADWRAQGQKRLTCGW